MNSVSRSGRRTLVATAGITAAALVLSACGGGSDDGGDGGSSGGGGGTLTIGTSDKVTTIDPAGSYDNGSFAVQNQVFPFLMNTPVGSPDVEPDIATKAEFTNPTTYEVTLKDGLEFANGNKLTSSDVKFSFDRELKINNENGPQSLLANLKSIDTPDDTTVVFNLDQVNNLVSNGQVSCVSNGLGATVENLNGGNTIGIGNHGGEWDGSVGSHNDAGASFTQSLDSAGSVDAISQSIVLGANVQLNNLTFTGHDSVVADHGSTAHHDGSAG